MAKNSIISGQVRAMQSEMMHDAIVDLEEKDKVGDHHNMVRLLAKEVGVFDAIEKKDKKSARFVRALVLGMAGEIQRAKQYIIDAKAQEAVIREQRREAEVTLDAYEAAIKEQMPHCKLGNVSDPDVSITVAPSKPKVIIDDADLLTHDFIVEKVQYSPDKVQIGAALTLGQDVPGAHLEEVLRLTIKDMK